MTESFVPTNRLFSYTRDEKDQTCQRAGYLSREWGGTGLVPKSTSWDLVYGNIIHKWLDQLAQHQKVDYAAVRLNVLTEASKCFDLHHAQDWAAQAEGHLRAFADTIWPLWMQEYEVFEPESWIEYEVEPGYVYRARRDLILISRFDSHKSYREYKTTSTSKPEFFAAFSKDVQLHTGMVLEKLVNGTEIRDGVMQSFSKGYKDKKLSTQRHPFAQGYVNREYSMTPQYSVSYQRSKGWETFSTFTEFSDLSQWISVIANKHPDVLSEQLGRTAPIFPREDIVQTYFRQRMYRQRKIAEGVELLQKALTVETVEAILDEYWPQNFSKCDPKFGGFKCEFMDACWIPYVGADPLGSGLFSRYDSNRDTIVEVDDNG